MNLEKYQSEDFESTNENKYIKNQLHEFDFIIIVINIKHN